MSIYDDAKIPPEQYCWVRGKINYSRISKRIDGGELETLNQQRQYALKPHTTITVKNATIEIYPNHDFSDLDKLVEQQFYVPNHGDKTLYYSAKNYLQDLPFVAVRKGKEIVQIPNTNELATGLDVSLILKTYRSTTHTGLMLVGVVCNEEPRFFTEQTIEDELQKRGLVFTPLQQQDLLSQTKQPQH